MYLAMFTECFTCTGHRYFASDTGVLLGDKLGHGPHLAVRDGPGPSVIAL